MAELAAAMSPAVAITKEDLWDWLGQENPVFSNIAGLYESPAGARLLPETMPAVAGSPEKATAPESPADHLELLLVDQTFGTEELASYSRHIEAVEETPRLLMHPGEADKMGLGAGDRVALRLPGGELRLALQVAENMAPGVMVLPRHRQLNWRLAPDYRVWVARGDLAKVND